MHERPLPIHVLLAVTLGALLFIGISASGAQAQSSQTTSDLVERTRALMGVTERLRGLSFLRDLPVDLVSQEQIADIIERELDEEITDEMDRAFSAMYAMLGLVPPRSSLRQAYQEMAEEQVAGLYDPDEKRFYVVDIDLSAVMSSMFTDFAGPLGSFLEGFFEGISMNMADTMTDTIIVHELTHALDDQHFDIQSMMDELMAADSDDAQLAYQSLLEGNATRIMNDYAYGMTGLDPSMAETMAEWNLALIENIMDYSPFLERIMVVPYLEGEMFVRYLVELEGQRGLDRAFVDPPASMEQILHPERYTPRRDIPSLVSEPDLSPALPDWEMEAPDTLGELIIGLMFEMQTGRRVYGEEISDGWDGDRLTTWRGPEGDLAFAWVSVWDDAREARDFFDAYADLLELKHPAGSWERRGARSALYTGAGLAAALEIDGDTVVIVEGVPEADAQACLDAAWETPVAYH